MSPATGAAVVLYAAGWLVLAVAAQYWPGLVAAGVLVWAGVRIGRRS
jgi:hypothetical protein